MKISDKIIIAYKDIENRKIRSILTIIGISIGTLLLLMMMGIGDEIGIKTAKFLDKFGENGKRKEVLVLPYKDDSNDGSTIDFEDVQRFLFYPIGYDSVEAQEEILLEDKNIKDSDVENIEKIDGIEYVTPIVEAKATGLRSEKKEYNKVINVNGIPIRNDGLKKSILEGKYIQKDNEFVIGEELAKTLFKEDINEALGKEIVLGTDFPELLLNKKKDNKDITGKIVGIIKKNSGHGDAIITSEKVAERLLTFFSKSNNHLKEKGYSKIMVQIDGNWSGEDICSDITKKTGLAAIEVESSINIGAIVKGAVKVAFASGGVIVLIVAALGLVNTITININEKRNMIGVMRSVGGSKRNIISIFKYEFLIFGLIGGALGTVLGIVVIHIINGMVIGSGVVSIPISSFNITVSFIITVLVCLISGIIPSTRAVSMNILESLDEE